MIILYDSIFHLVYTWIYTCSIDFIVIFLYHNIYISYIYIYQYISIYQYLYIYIYIYINIYIYHIYIYIYIHIYYRDIYRDTDIWYHTISLVFLLQKNRPGHGHFSAKLRNGRAGGASQGRPARSRCQWIGLMEKLQENPIFHGKIYGFRFRFSLKPIHWDMVNLWFRTRKCMNMLEYHRTI